MDIISRKVAINQELIKYFTGKECKNGHISERYTVSRVCVCFKLEYGRIPEVAQKGREQKAAYKLANGPHVKKTRLAWEKRNPGKMAQHTARRKALKLQATPIWANKDAIEIIYEESSNRSENTHVDHVLPLQGTIVCGLHVETNLQIILAHDNLTKHNSIDQDVESEYQLNLTAQCAKSHAL